MAVLKRLDDDDDDDEEEEEKYTGKKNALREIHTHERECVVSIVSKFNTTTTREQRRRKRRRRR